MKLTWALGAGFAMLALLVPQTADAGKKKKKYAKVAGYSNYEVRRGSGFNWHDRTGQSQRHGAVWQTARRGDKVSQFFTQRMLDGM